MQPEDRDRVVKEFREGVTKILISTDVLSRGFDVSQVCAGSGCRVLAGKNLLGGLRYGRNTAIKPWTAVYCMAYALSIGTGHCPL